ncbi:MAG: hypothetical protein JWM98_845 [Thermoleophilia bacterium]|nr:hypothetical protein [Thermoleophilia bacterium]
MTAHASTITAPPALPARRHAARPRRQRRRPTLRLALLLAAVGITFLCLTEGDSVAGAAHATCVLGTPHGTTCGEALVKVGYP